MPHSSTLRSTLFEALRSAIRATRTEADDERMQPSPSGASSALALLLVAGVALAMMDAVGGAGDWPVLLRFVDGVGLDEAVRRVAGWMRDPVAGGNHRLIYWALQCQLWYLAVPLLWALVAARLSLRQLGLGFGRLRGHAPIYLGLALLGTPLLVLASTLPAFQRLYPYFEPLPGQPLWPGFWRLELLYFAQFIAVEFFFRGFLVQGLRPTFGYASIYVALLPYCMIHFGKPLPEVLGALGAGLILGHLSLASRSIWAGIALHIYAAAVMDLSVLWQSGYRF